MKSFVADNIYWVGIVAWEELRGSAAGSVSHQSKSFNSYLITEKSTVLIDTVAKPHAARFLDNLGQELPLTSIDYCVLNSCHEDHTGALPELVESNPSMIVAAASRWLPRLRKKLPEHALLVGVDHGDVLDLGGKSLVYSEAARGRKSRDVFWYLDGVVFCEYASDYLVQDFRKYMKSTAKVQRPFTDGLRGGFARRLGQGMVPNIICTNHGIPILLG